MSARVRVCSHLLAAAFLPSPLLGNGRNTVSRVLFRRRELTEPHWVLRQTRWVQRRTWWVRVYTQIIGWKELTEFAPRNSVSPEKLTEFGVWNRTPRNRIRPVSDLCMPLMTIFRGVASKWPFSVNRVGKSHVAGTSRNPVLPFLVFFWIPCFLALQGIPCFFERFSRERPERDDDNWEPHLVDHQMLHLKSLCHFTIQKHDNTRGN